MGYLNANIPPQKVLVRKEYLRNLEDSFQQYLEGWIFAVCSIRSRALLFHVLLENGALYYRLPISAFCSKKCEPVSLEVLQTWDSLSYNIGVIEYAFLQQMCVSCKLRDESIQKGMYKFTIDYCHSAVDDINTGLSETPSEHKCHHFIELDSGNFALLPNNRIFFKDASLAWSDVKPDFKINEHLFTSETETNFVASNEFNYSFVKKK